MKKVIALRGIAKVGKSTTINKVYALLRNKYPTAKIEHEKSTRVEITAVLTIDGVKLGIESHGDPGSVLEESLRLFARLGCQLIICATRTRGQTVDAVGRLAPSFEVLWFNQENSSDQEFNNNKMAMQIVAESEKVIRRNVAK